MSSQFDDLQSLTFEQAYTELVETVQKLEAGNLSLADTLAFYERGMALSQYCDQHLAQAELSIKTLASSGALEDFEE